MEIISVWNRKGGSGKTSTVINLGAALAMDGRRVLLVDNDMQANLSDAFGIDCTSEDQPCSFDWLFEDVGFDDVVWRGLADQPNLHLIPASEDLDKAEVRYLDLGIMGGSYMRKRISQTIPQDEYDFIIVDSGPAKNLTSTNALVAAQWALAPAVPDKFSWRGVEAFIDYIGEVTTSGLNPTLQTLGILLSQCAPREEINRAYVKAYRDTYGATVFDSTIEHRTELKKSIHRSRPIVVDKPQHPVSKAFRALSKEVADRTQTAAHVIAA
jgi:chromosome partitioning protein